MREICATGVILIVLSFTGHAHFSASDLHGRYFVDDYSGIWTKFDGIGAISGGGATSKLLINYREPHRSHILDFLFKPKFAASLQILKVEIGGDSQSSDGSESSHMHRADDENYSRGYQWWLMTEAKKRNPDIKLYGLPWTFPGWVGGGVFNPFYNRTATVRYIMNWINGALRFHNLKINYIGVWNERDCDKEYVKLLRSTLDAEGLDDVLLVAPDAQSWDILKTFAADAEFLNSVDIVGQHYPGASSPEAALRLDKMLWASEEYSTYNDVHGGGCWARVLVESPVRGFYTGIIAWNLIASYYDHLPYSRDGLMTAHEPWSGHYQVSSPVWMTAHHTQFYSPGWLYLRHGRGLGTLLGNGSYVSLTTADRQHLTIVIQTLRPDDAPCSYFMPKFSVADQQSATFSLHGPFSSIQKLYVWYSSFNFTGNSSIFFQQRSPITVVNGSFTLKLRANEVYTLTTVADGNKGSYDVPPNSSAFPVPYVETFENYSVGEEPFNLAQQSGSFEVTTINAAAAANDEDEDEDDDDDDNVNDDDDNVDDDVRGDKVMTQVVTQPPVDTCRPERMPRPLTIIGDFRWTNVSVQIDVLLVKTSDGSHATGAFVASNVDIGGCWAMYANGVYLWVSADSQRAKLTGNQTGTLTYDEVDLPSVQYGHWFTLGLDVLGNNVTATFDNKTIMSMNIPSLSSPNGFVAVGPDRFGVASFDNLHIARADTSPAAKTVLTRDRNLKVFVRNEDAQTAQWTNTINQNRLLRFQPKTKPTP